MIRGEETVWTLRLLSGVAAVAWALANTLDVFSALLIVQAGGRLLLGYHHPAEYLLIYAGMRFLIALAVYLMAVFVSKHWPVAARVAWSALAFCALATAVIAWWRLGR